MVSAGLGSLHHRHPLVIITEEGEVEVRTAAVGLGTDGQLTQQPTHRLGVPAIFGIDYSVFESEAQTDRYQRDNIKQQHQSSFLALKLNSHRSASMILKCFSTYFGFKFRKH